MSPTIGEAKIEATRQTKRSVGRLGAKRTDGGVHRTARTAGDGKDNLRVVNLLLRSLPRQARHKADQITPVVKPLVVDWMIVP